MMMMMTMMMMMMNLGGEDTNRCYPRVVGTRNSGTYLSVADKRKKRKKRWLNSLARGSPNPLNQGVYPYGPVFVIGERQRP